MDACDLSQKCRREKDEKHGKPATALSNSTIFGMETTNVKVSRNDIYFYVTISVSGENAMHYSERIQSAPSEIHGESIY